jgi:formylglycine-generating enzyme required for sulfatase activity
LLNGEGFMRVLLAVLIALCWVRGGVYAEEFRVPPEMVLIPAGPSWMGSNRGDVNESPLHKVHLSAYAIDRREVSLKAYRIFAEATGRKMPEVTQDPRFSDEDHPATGVTWDEADAYCGWSGRRLPTEAEWEKAARGESGRTFPWGEPPPTLQLLNFADSLKATARVGTYPGGASPYGVEDMAGNAAEWVDNWYDPEIYTSNGVVYNPEGPAKGRMKVVRGGSWQSREHFVRSSARQAKRPTERSPTVGFRCAMTPVPARADTVKTVATDSLRNRDR